MEERYHEIKKLIEEAGMEHPSANFLQNVMTEVTNVAVERSVQYQPLISKKSWLLIGFIIASLLIFLVFLEEGSSVMGTIDLSFLNMKDIKNPLSGFRFHNTTTYGIIFLAILFMVQITVIKRRIDKTFSI